MSSIYKTPDGAVLKTPDGKLVGQPYNFGNAFNNKMGLNNYIEITGLDISPYFTILTLGNDTNTAIAGRSYSFNLRDSNNDNYSCAKWYSGYNSLAISKNGAFTEAGLNILVGHGTSSMGTAGQYCRSFSSISTKQNYCRQDTLFQSPLLTNVSPANLNTIWLGAVRLTNGTSPSQYSSPNFKHSRFIVYDRELSTSEYRYFYNNKIGNDPQLNEGLLLDIRMQFAEVINISGVDQPCVRDYSGNNYHGIIMNLPAGTAQQKVDFANANLFVPFQ